MQSIKWHRHYGGLRISGQQSIGYASLNFMFTEILLLKKAYRVLGLISKSFECKDPDVIVRLYRYNSRQLLCSPSLNIIMFYGDLLTYLIIKTRKNPT